MRRARIEMPVVVVGAGVVGLAAAAEIAGLGAPVLLVERHPGPGRETSSHNSGVIHAGIYYPPGSLKAAACVRGAALLRERCRRDAIPHRITGKLVVACDPGEEPELERLRGRGETAGARDLRLLTAGEVAALEPEVRARAALWSPWTGVVDPHALVMSLLSRARAAGADALFGWALVGAERLGTDARLRVALRGPGGEVTRVEAAALVNAAGLEADRVSALAGVPVPPLHWVRGDYFRVAGPAADLVSRLVYPVPSARAAGLGIHVTLPAEGGGMRLGPDARAVRRQRPQPDVDPARAALFHRAAARYLPRLPADALRPESFGLRPRLGAPGGGFRDFVVRREEAGGQPGLVNLLGIESPGLTAALALGERVRELVRPLL